MYFYSLSPSSPSLVPSFFPSFPPYSPPSSAHTPDNSFLGFVVEQHKSSSSPPPTDSRKSLVYGKELYMWKNKKDYLEVIAQYFDVQATIGNVAEKGATPDWSIVPPFVHNQGILNGEQLQQLLQVQHSQLFTHNNLVAILSFSLSCVFFLKSKSSA